MALVQTVYSWLTPAIGIIAEMDMGEAGHGIDVLRVDHHRLLEQRARCSAPAPAMPPPSQS